MRYNKSYGRCGTRMRVHKKVFAPLEISLETRFKIILTIGSTNQIVTLFVIYKNERASYDCVIEEVGEIVQILNKLKTYRLLIEFSKAFNRSLEETYLEGVFKKYMSVFVTLGHGNGTWWLDENEEDEIFRYLSQMGYGPGSKKGEFTRLMTFLRFRASTEGKFDGLITLCEDRRLEEEICRYFIPEKKKLHGLIKLCHTHINELENSKLEIRDRARAKLKEIEKSYPSNIESEKS